MPRNIIIIIVVVVVVNVDIVVQWVSIEIVQIRERLSTAITCTSI